MAVAAADQLSCTPSCKCLVGPNKGYAYQCDDPCGGLTGPHDFDSTICDCEPRLPVGAIRYVLDSGNVKIQSTSNNFTGVCGAPYFNGEGKYVTFVPGMRWTWGCASTFVSNSCCSPGGVLAFPCPWQANGSATKTNLCSGGSTNVGDLAYAVYHDNVLQQVVQGAVIAALQSGFCDNARYPVGYNWSWTGHFEQEVSAGVWEPL